LLDEDQRWPLLQSRAQLDVYVTKKPYNYTTLIVIPQVLNSYKLLWIDSHRDKLKVIASRLTGIVEALTIACFEIHSKLYGAREELQATVDFTMELVFGVTISIR